MPFALDINEIIGTLKDLFQQKLTFMREMKERELSLAEKTEFNKNELEYAKLDSQIKTDKDRLSWEKDKAMLGFKNGMDLQTLHNQGLLDVEKLRGANEKDRAQITAEATKYGHDVTALASVLGHTKTVEKLDPETGKVVGRENPSPGAAGISQRLASNVGLGPKPVSRVDLDNATIRIAELQKSNPAAAVAELQRMRTSNPDLYDAIKLTPSAPVSTPAPAPVAPVTPEIASRLPQANNAPAATAPAPVVNPVIQPRQPETQPVSNTTAFGRKSPIMPFNDPEQIAANRATQDQVNATASAAEATRPRLPAPPTIAQSFGLGNRSPVTPVSIGGMNKGVIPQTQQAVDEAKKKRRRNTIQTF